MVPQHDPIAQSTAEKFSKVFGEAKPEELLEEQRKVYEFIKEKEEWLAKIKKEGKLKDPKEGHSIALRTMQNRTRREILAFIEDGKRLKAITEVFDLGESAAKFHLDMLENVLYIAKVTKEGDIYYCLTPLLGEEYLENVEKQR